MIEMEYIDATLFDKPLVLDSGKYKGYNYWIISYGSHPCAYVELPKGHIYYGKCDCDAYDLPIDVHGGITYGNYGLHNTIEQDKFLLGWDYNHFGDYSNMNSVVFCDTGKRWTTEEILEDVKKVIEQLQIQKDMRNDRFKFRAWYDGRYIYKDLCDSNYYTEDGKCIGLANTLPNDLPWEQCTGLKDKNGKLIYEGDLIKEPANSHNLKVMWENGAWQTEEYRKNGHREQLLYCLVNCYGVEIVGNIHENKEEG